ncbi:MAG: cobalamin biosynthesis protein CobD [Nitrospirae bacterium RBG_19FT_COMBO_55_12]|nr:MAG: cobalamin biosynthesis protein CobD [Nitrospirae bacterium RBG_19FT_COMBO_55_12]
MHSLVIASAFILDLIFGDPPWFPHPVRFIGRMILLAEKGLRNVTRSPRSEKAAGVLLVLIIVTPVYFLTRLLISTASSLSITFGFLISAVTAYTTLATRGLADAARLVQSRLEDGDIVSARKELSMIVGRDTANLNEQEIARAVIETVAENASDGVVAPLFYLAIGGPALAMAYKAVNTLDSMVGYKNEKYVNFGWAAAKLDDVANYIPARITAVLISLAAVISRRLKQVLSPSPRSSPARGKGDSELRTQPALESLYRGNSELRTLNFELSSPWRVMLRDGRNHLSPNSGYPEAAMAGALGIRLGGPSAYAGKIAPKPSIGAGGRPPDKKDIANSVRLMYCSTLSAALGAVAVNFFLTKIVRVL